MHKKKSHRFHRLENQRDQAFKCLHLDMMLRGCREFVKPLLMVLLCITLSPGQSLSGGTPFAFKYNGKTHAVRSRVFDGLIHFNSEDMKAVIGFEMKRETATGKVSFCRNGKRIAVCPDNPWLLLDSEIVNVPTLCRIEKGAVWLPLPLLNEVLGHFIEIKVEVKERKLVSQATRFRIRKIIIDPGHGGKDPGAVGRDGLYEKDVALAIAKLTAELLESELGITCVLTRDSDVFIPLGRRARIANKHKADLFLSIHCNACKKRDKSGTEIYFMSTAKTNWARAVAARENASVKYETEEERGEVESILWDLAQTEFLKESNALSGRLLKCLIAAIGSKSRGVKQANFYVLRGVYMPACLVEVEFISHPKWEKKLKRKDFQMKAATGIVQGVKEFKDWYEGLKR